MRPRHAALAAALLLPAAAAAQAPADDAAARAEVMAVVRRLFDGMRAGDSAAVRAVFHPQARLGSALVRDGTPEVRFDSVGTFVRAVGTPHAEVWDERTANETVLVDGPLAVAWTPYWFHAGTRFSHCGVNTFQLARTADGWRIVSLIDTRQRTGCAPSPAPAR